MSETNKTPTEEFKLSDAWSGFKNNYLPFVEWMRDATDSFEFIQITFLEDVPVEYSNKWQRTQWKMAVMQGTDKKILSGGKKLFVRIKDLCLEIKKNPTKIGEVQIDRFGSGFETDYRIIVIPKTDKKSKK